MGVIEDFIQSENNKTGRTGNYPGTEPQYYFAKDYSLGKDAAPATTTTIRPSVAGQILAAFLLASGVLMWLLLFRFILLKTMLPVTITALVFVSCCIAALVWFFFLHPRLVYKIVLTAGGIRLQLLFLPWSSLQDCLIMVKGLGRRRECRLVLFTSNNNIHTFNIGYLNISNEQLLNLIEQYRSKA